MNLLINILNHIHRNLFHLLRTQLTVAYLYVASYPLKQLNFSFYVFGGKQRREVRFNSQVMLLERALNLRYLDMDKWATYASPTANNGIYIDSTTVITNLGYAWNLNEGQPNEGYAYNIGETPIEPPAHTVEYAYNLSEFLGQTLFIVMVPSWLTFDQTEMRAFIDKYRMAGRTYTIQTY